MTPFTVYVASRASVPDRPLMWRTWREKGLPIISSWIDEAGEGQTADNMDLWMRIHGEVAQASGLVLFVTQDDFPLKGALIEVGMALALNKPVALVAPGVMLQPHTGRPLGSWIHHPNVHLAPSIPAAFRHLEGQHALEIP